MANVLPTEAALERARDDEAAAAASARAARARLEDAAASRRAPALHPALWYAFFFFSGLFFIYIYKKQNKTNSLTLINFKSDPVEAVDAEWAQDLAESVRGARARRQVWTTFFFVACSISTFVYNFHT